MVTILNLRDVKLFIFSVVPDFVSLPALGRVLLHLSLLFFVQSFNFSFNSCLFADVFILDPLFLSLFFSFNFVNLLLEDSSLLHLLFEPDGFLI